MANAHDPEDAHVWHQDEDWDELTVRHKYRSLAADNEELREKVTLKDKAILAEQEHARQAEQRQAEAEHYMHAFFRVIKTAATLAEVFNDGDPANSGFQGVARDVETGKLITGPWFEWAYQALRFAVSKRSEWQEEEEVSASEDAMPGVQQGSAQTDVLAENAPPEAKQPPITPPVPKTASPSAERSTLEAKVPEYASSAAVDRPSQPLVPEERPASHKDTRTTAPQPAAIPKPKHNFENWPWNNDPNPGDQPTPYDLYHGQFIKPEDCEPWEQPADTKFPVIPNMKTESLKKDGTPYKNCAGDVCWTTPKQAAKGIDYDDPEKMWFIKKNGTKLFRWNTKSHTRSRTLLPYQTLPEPISFVENDIIHFGPYWTCTSQAVEHDRRIPCWAFDYSACSFCGMSRAVSGTAFVHDFCYTGPRKDKGQRPVHANPWPVGVLTQRKRSKKDDE